MKYSSELKEQILQEVKESKSIVAVAKKHGMPDSTIYNWLSKKRLKPVSDLASENKKLKAQLLKTKQTNDILKDMLKKSCHIFDSD